MRVATLLKDLFAAALLLTCIGIIGCTATGPGNLLEIEVLDDVTTAPVAGARVDVWQFTLVPEINLIHIDSTNVHGFVQFEVENWEAWNLDVSAPGYALLMQELAAGTHKCTARLTAVDDVLQHGVVGFER